MKFEEVKIKEVEIVIDDWKEQIENAYGKHLSIFYDKIWEMSQDAFDKPREVQVVIDGNDKLFISVGTPGFVSFEGQESQLKGMKLPLVTWIHTHPFGDAYFSGTDLRTIAIWNRFLYSAIVLGNEERMGAYFRVGPNGEDYQEYTQHRFLGDEEE